MQTKMGGVGEGGGGARCCGLWLLFAVGGGLALFLTLPPAPWSLGAGREKGKKRGRKGG